MRVPREAVGRRGTQRGPRGCALVPLVCEAHSLRQPRLAKDSERITQRAHKRAVRLRRVLCMRSPRHACDRTAKKPMPIRDVHVTSNAAGGLRCLRLPANALRTGQQRPVANLVAHEGEGGEVAADCNEASDDVRRMYKSREGRSGTDFPTRAQTRSQASRLEWAPVTSPHGPCRAPPAINMIAECQLCQWHSRTSQRHRQPPAALEGHRIFKAPQPRQAHAPNRHAHEQSMRCTGRCPKDTTRRWREALRSLT